MELLKTLLLIWSSLMIALAVWQGRKVQRLDRRKRELEAELDRFETQ
jgi:hypothetical protein